MHLSYSQEDRLLQGGTTVNDKVIAIDSSKAVVFCLLPAKGMMAIQLSGSNNQNLINQYKTKLNKYDIIVVYSSCHFLNGDIEYVMYQIMTNILKQFIAKVNILTFPCF